MTDKVKELTALAELLSTIRANGSQVVLCHGCFDPLHVGHVRYFTEARGHGDILVVTVTPDRYVDKGPMRPLFEAAVRAEVVAALDVVDYVSVNQWPTAEETLRLLRPHVYVKGQEFEVEGADPTGKMERERKVVDEIGARMAFTDTMVMSSTRLLGHLGNGRTEAD